jgi:hypothetical protein
MKHLHKFFNKLPILWVQLVWDHYYSRNNLPSTDRSPRGSFWWKDILKLLDSFKEMARISVQNDSTCFLWLDLWGQNVCQQSYPELFSYDMSQYTTLRAATTTATFQDLFYLPLSMEAFEQFQELFVSLQSLQLNQSNDVWSYVWGSPFYSSKQAYKQLIDHRQVPSDGCGHLLVRTKGRFSSG